MKIAPAYAIPQTGPATRAAVDRFLAASRLMRLGVTEPDADLCSGTAAPRSRVYPAEQG